ncbi:hypothetical protein GOODEAATRI_032764 [Goodea atripinnis]|uniref:Uncharacterized protein n=1 Tax=Goodea atripinnis TaxID=208336 RepID=A0ABV0NH44_9TELE
MNYVMSAESWNCNECWEVYFAQSFFLGTPNNCMTTLPAKWSLAEQIQKKTCWNINFNQYNHNCTFTFPRLGDDLKNKRYILLYQSPASSVLVSVLGQDTSSALRADDGQKANCMAAWLLPVHPRATM